MSNDQALNPSISEFPYEKTPLWKRVYNGPASVIANNHGKHIPILFTPYKVRNLTLKNRAVVSPMCQYSSEDGFFNDWHLVHLGSFARGGAGLVFTEATAVSPEGRISPNDAGLWKDAQKEQLQRIVTFIHLNKAAAGIQLAHAGRKASTPAPFFTVSSRDPQHKNLQDKRFKHAVVPEDGGWTPVGPSPLAWSEEYALPAELSVDEIKKLVNDFGEAAKRAVDIGFDVIEIHGAHGYLINSFLSPLSNTRTDAYGGNLEGRSRFLIEIASKIREVVPKDFPIFTRLSAVEWVPGGTTVEDTIYVAKKLKEVGVDLIDTSSGGNNVNQKIKVEPGYQVPFAEQVKKGADVPTGAVGLITGPEQAEEILQKGQADLIFMAREFLREPNWVLKAAKILDVDVEWPVQYERSRV